MGPVRLPFADSDLAPLVKRYSSSAIVTMLREIAREIARCKSAKLDWVVLCKGTATGITNPKEYQALWRSIAYHAELNDSFDDNDPPMEDDSDIEVELDPVPSVTPTVAQRISSFVKADLGQHELEGARLEQKAVQTGMELQAGDIAVDRSQQGSGLLGKSDDSAALAVTANARAVPYLASATQCAVTHGEPTATLTCSTSKAAYSGDRKRRRLWTPEEDLALIAAVDKCGEGNWTTVLKNHSDFDRSASQLSQRWALIRKRREVQEKAGYVATEVSPLASGFKDVRPEGLKSGTVAGSGSQLGTPKDVGRQGDKIMPSGNVPMPIKQPLSTSVPVIKRPPVASTPTGTETTPASVLETQRMRVLPASGVPAGVPGQRPQAHNQASMRGSATAGASGAGQVHKGATPEGHASGVRRPAQGPSVGSQMFYTSTHSVTSTIPIDSKYAASRTIGAGMARGVTKGLHGPDPMIQAAAMAAGARIAPASTAASLLKAAQSGNVVHIGSGGLPRSKLGLTSQAGSGNAGGSPGIVHYIRTGSGGASLATTSAGLQRTSSHHMQKPQSTQPNRGLGSNSGSHPAGNSSPLSAPTVPPQASRNNAQVPVQSSKQVSSSKRGSSPQQKTTSPSNPTSNSTPALASTPALTGALASVSTSAPISAPTSVATPAPASAPSTPARTATTALAPTSVATPAPTSVATPASTSAAAPAPTSIPSTPARTATTALAPTSVATPAPTSSAAPASTSVPSTLARTAATTFVATPAPTSVPTPKSTATTTRAPTSVPTPKSTATATPAPTSVATPAPTSAATPAPASVSTPAPSPVATPASTPAATPASTPAPSSVSIPALSSVAAPASASVAPSSVSTPAPASISTPASTATSTPPTSISSPASNSISTSVPASATTSQARPAVTSIATPAPKSTPAPAPTHAATPVCGFNTAEEGTTP